MAMKLDVADGTPPLVEVRRGGSATIRQMSQSSMLAWHIHSSLLSPVYPDRKCFLFHTAATGKESPNRHPQ
jgi:hypothetical protein